jgi:hypothetical protein
MIGTFQFIIVWLSPSHPLTNLEIETYKNKILPVDLGWCADSSQCTGCCRDDAPDLYSGDAPFQYGLGHRLS